MPLLAKYLFGDTRLEKIQTKWVGLDEFCNIKTPASDALSKAQLNPSKIYREKQSWSC